MANAATAPGAKVSSAKVFVSYSREDKDFTRQLFMVLEDKGFGPLMDVRAIDPGEPWQERLTNLIDQCDTVVFVLSDHYLASPSCTWEVDEAKKRHKRLVPILPAKLSRTDVPPTLASLQYIYFYADPNIPDSGFYDGIRKLEQALRQDLDWLRLRRRYEERADDWQAKNDADLLLEGQLLEEANLWSVRLPEGQFIPPVVEAYLAASRQREQKRIARERRFRLISVAAFVAGIALAVAAAAGWLGYLQADKGLTEAKTELKGNVAEHEADTAIVLKASKLQAAALSELNLYRGLRKIEADKKLALGQEGPVDGGAQSLALYKQADDLFAGLSRNGAASFASLIDDVWRGLGGSQFVAGDPLPGEPSAATWMTRITTRPAPGVSEQKAQTQLASDYIARAVYSCADPARAGKIAQELAEAPDSVKPFFLWQAAETAASGKSLCGEARDAICKATPDCPPEPQKSGPGGPGPIIDELPQGEKQVAFSDAQKAPYVITEIYLHIASKADRPDAQKLQAAIEAVDQPGQPKYKVLGIQLVDPPKEGKSNRSVRYYYAPQAAQAGLLGPMVAELAAKAGLTRWADPKSYPVVSLAGRYDGLPPHRVEIWL